MTEPQNHSKQALQDEQQPRMETTVKQYKNAKDFQKDQLAMAQDGWSVATTTAYQPRQGIGSMAALCFVGAAIFKPDPQIVVTYNRIARPGAPTPVKATMPAGLSFKEQVQWRKEHRTKT